MIVDVVVICCRDYIWMCHVNLGKEEEGEGGGGGRGGKVGREQGERTVIVYM